MNAKRAIGTVLVTAGAVSAAYPLMLRTWFLNWGATHDEVARTIPGDELNPRPDTISTRAITIDAPPNAIWPWLVQMGSGRGCAYTYDWIENLFGSTCTAPTRSSPSTSIRTSATCCRSARTASASA